MSRERQSKHNRVTVETLKKPFRAKAYEFALASSPPLVVVVPALIYTLTTGDFKSAETVVEYGGALTVGSGFYFRKDFDGAYDQRQVRKEEKRQRKWQKEWMKEKRERIGHSLPVQTQEDTKPYETEWKRAKKERDEQEHEKSVPYAETIDSFLHTLQETPGFFETLNEKYEPETPFSETNMPEQFDLSTVPTDEGFAYSIRYDGHRGERVEVIKIKMDETDECHNMTLAEAVVSVRKRDGLYWDPFAKHHILPYIGPFEYQTPAALQKAKDLFVEVLPVAQKA